MIRGALALLMASALGTVTATLLSLPLRRLGIKQRSHLSLPELLVALAITVSSLATLTAIVRWLLDRESERLVLLATAVWVTPLGVTIGRTIRARLRACGSNPVRQPTDAELERALWMFAGTASLSIAAYPVLLWVSNRTAHVGVNILLAVSSILIPLVGVVFGDKAWLFMHRR